MGEIILDTKGDFCPIPIVKLGRKIREVAVGEVVRLISDDPGVEQDVRAWCRSHKHQLVGAHWENEVFFALIRKA
jgi:tRNA 2-thiouridine synthesizing protein A